jgi:hypothetical protein
VTRFQELAELLGDAVLFTSFQLQQDMFLGWKVEEERAVGDAGGGDDGTHIGLGHSRPLELGSRRAQQTFPGLQALCFARRWHVRHSHVRSVPD